MKETVMAETSQPTKEVDIRFENLTKEEQERYSNGQFFTYPGTNIKVVVIDYKNFRTNGKPTLCRQSEFATLAEKQISKLEACLDRWKALEAETSFANVKLDKMTLKQKQELMAKLQADMDQNSNDGSAA